MTLAFDAATADACPDLACWSIRGVVNRESPRWLKERLQAIGLRPISMLVDITNYLTFDLCRPLHVFDAALVRGSLQVRLPARDGERLLALNGEDYALTPEMTVIADDAGPEALGGVIGGERTGCTAATTTVFLSRRCSIRAALPPPAALSIFSPMPASVSSAASIRRSWWTVWSWRRRLVLDLCAAARPQRSLSSLVPHRRPQPPSPSAERVQALTGVHVSDEESGRILSSLGFGIACSASPWPVTTPSWRSDIVGEACLVEERCASPATTVSR